MKVRAASEVEATPIEAVGAHGVNVRVLLGRAHGAPMEWHGFEADWEEGMRMLWLVPNRAYVPGRFRIDEGQ